MSSTDLSSLLVFFFFSTHPSPPEIYTLSLHDALPIWSPLRSPSARGLPMKHARRKPRSRMRDRVASTTGGSRSEEHTSELQSLRHLVCRLLLEKKKKRPHHATGRTIAACVPRDSIRGH